jgi:hypothetical protein
MFMMIEIRNFLHQQWLEFKEDKYSMALLLVVLIVGAGISVKKGRAWYIARRESAAQVIFADAYDEYQGALKASLNKEDAGKIEQAFKDATIGFESVQETQSGSTYSIYAKAFQADILTHEKQYDKAVLMLEEALADMSVSSPAYYLYKTKMALILFDAGQAPKGAALLEELVNDSNNEQSDTAAFYLGSFYWSEKQYDKAKAAWKMFDKPISEKEPQKNSPWAHVVAAKLAQLS